MIDQPRFKAHWRVEIVADDGVFLLSEKGPVVLRGRVYEQVAPLIDGRRSTDEIAEQLEEAIPPAEVYHALRHLEKKGYLADGNGPVLENGHAFWHLQDVDMTVAAERLAQAAVALFAVGGVDTAPMAAALTALDVRVADEGQVAVVLTDDYLRQGLAAFNEQALQSARPWLLVKPIGHRIWVGPVFQPGETACWECLAQRLRANRAAEVYVQEKTGRADPFPVPPADTPTTRAIAWNMAATEVVRSLARGGVSALVGKILTLDVLSWKTEWHTVLRRPQCPACGKPEGAREPAIVLQSRKKRFTRDSGHRGVLPEETLRRYEHHVSCISGAVTLLERVRCAGDGVVNVYAAGHNFARRQRSLEGIRRGLRNDSSGKGTSDLQARASGLCEALERYCGVFRGDEPRIGPCRMRDLGEAAIHPNACMLYSEKQFRERQAWNSRGSSFNRVPEPFDEDQPIEWTPLWSLTRSEVRYLPTAFCFYDYPMERPYSFACSNGNAAGNSLEEAILQGFFELVERDAVALWWYSRVRRPGVDLANVDEPYLRQLAAYLYEHQHRELWVLDLTSDLQVPVFAALSRRADRQPEEILMGFGAHFDARIALLRAVTELNQMLTCVLTDPEGKSLVSEGLDDPETLEWLKTATLENQPYLVPADGPPRNLCDFSQQYRDDLRDDVLACQALVEQQGLEMLVLDQTRADIGLPVVKVIVPGLRHFWARFAPGRLYDVPVQLGWFSEPLREEQLNPIPVFL